MLPSRCAYEPLYPWLVFHLSAVSSAGCCHQQLTKDDCAGVCNMYIVILARHFYHKLHRHAGVLKLFCIQPSGCKLSSPEALHASGASAVLLAVAAGLRAQTYSAVQARQAMQQDLANVQSRLEAEQLQHSSDGQAAAVEASGLTAALRTTEEELAVSRQERTRLSKLTVLHHAAAGSGSVAQMPRSCQLPVAEV